MTRAETPVQGAELSKASRRITYEPGLDGLRAISVLATFLVHAHLGIAPGGFLGVSTFFTLSGFLITSVLLSEYRSNGRIVLGMFWQRRIRRLMPAALITIAVVSVASLWFGDAVQNHNLFGDVAGTLAYMANWRFILEGTTYAGEFSGQSPLLHFWSLAIEEQYYVVFPLVIAGTLAASARWRLAVPAALLLGVLWSLAAGIVASHSTTNIDNLYFRTDIRAGELLVGALFGYWWVYNGAGLREPFHRAIRWLGSGLLCVMFALMAVSDYHDLGWYRGGFIAYALVTVGVILAAVQPHGPVRWLLSRKPMVWVGVVSYGAYLAHWPFFLWLQMNTDLSGWVRLIVGTIATLAVAWISYRVVELPVRERRRFSVKWLIIVGLGLVVLALLLSWLAPKIARNTQIPVYLQQRDVSDVKVVEAAAPVPGVQVDSSRPSRVLLFGDSVASSLSAALGEALGKQGVAFANSALPGCGVVEGDPADEKGHAYEMTAACGAAVPRAQQTVVERVRPDLVVVFSSWESRDRIVDGVWAPYGTPDADRELLALYRRMVDRLTAQGARVALITIPDRVDSRRGPAEADVLRRTAHLNGLLVELAQSDPARITLVRLDEIICPTTPCPASVDGVALRPRDGMHFDNPVAAALVAERWVERLMQVQPGKP